MSVLRELGSLLVTVLALLAAGFVVLTAWVLDLALEGLSSTG